MSAIILFRYHRDYPVCIQTLTQLRRLNPGVSIHGMYGGEEDLRDIPAELVTFLDTNWKVPLEDHFYKWRNGDLCARLWFKAIGLHVDFDHAYFLEWDALFVKPLHLVYGQLEKGVNYGTLIGDYAHVIATGWFWLTHQYGWEAGLLVDELATQGRAVHLDSLSFGVMGASVICRSFFKRFSADTVGSYSNDELRFSVYSSVYGIELRDNLIWKKAEAGSNLYRVDDAIVLDESDLNRVLESGGDVIHPLRIVIDGLEAKLADT